MCQETDRKTGKNQDRLPDRKAEVTTYAYCSHFQRLEQLHLTRARVQGFHRRIAQIGSKFTSAYVNKRSSGPNQPFLAIHGDQRHSILKDLEKGTRLEFVNTPYL